MLAWSNEDVNCKKKVFDDDTKEGCHVDKGFEAGSVLCANCQLGYSRDGAAGCKPCYKGELKLFFPILVAVLILLLLLFFIWSTVIKRGGVFEYPTVQKIFASSTAGRAGLYHEHSLAKGILSCLRYKAGFFGREEYIDIRCTLSEPVSIAQIQYLKPLLWAYTSCAGTSLGRGMVCAGYSTEAERNADGNHCVGVVFRVACNYLSILQLWKCADFGEGVGLIFLIDPETKCTDSIHLLWRNFGLALCGGLYSWFTDSRHVALYATAKARRGIDTSSVWYVVRWVF